MKKSKYNYTLEHNGKYYIYNPYNGLCRIEHKVYDEYVLNEAESIPLNIRKILYKKKYLIEDDNEYLRFKIMRNRLIYNQDTLLLEIAPTLKCNCYCGYCFVCKNSITMSEKTEDNIIRFIEDRINHGVRNIKVSWFGGEPLLAYQNIYRLSKKLIALCSKRRVSYQAFMITNGILLNNDVVSRLEDLNIYGIQITLDGTEHYHNTVRPSANINGYKKILENLCLFTGKIKPIIRINVSKRNSHDIINLLVCLEPYAQYIKSISFSPVFSINCTSKDYESDILTGDEYASLEKQYLIMLQNSKLQYEFHIKGKYVGDASRIVNSFCIDPEGNLYKSGFMLGNKEYIIQNIQNFNLIECFYHEKFTECLDVDFDAICKNCFYLPYCLGGEISMTYGKCDSIRYNFETILRMYIDYIESAG